MAEFPALPLWTDAYLADCGHLSFAEHGAYLSILLLMWRSPECRIPNDDEWIMRKLRCDESAYRTSVKPILKEFCTTTGNWLSQKRLSKEWRWCREKKKKNTVSAKSRWEKEKIPSERNAKAMPPSHTLPTPTPTEDISSLRSDIGQAKKSRRQIPEGFPDLPAMSWAEQYWLKHGRTDLCSLMTDEIEKFRDHHKGKLTASADWAGSWRTWARNAIKFNNGGHNGRKQSAHDKFFEGAARYLDTLDGGTAEGTGDNVIALKAGRSLLPP